MAINDRNQTKKIKYYVQYEHILLVPKQKYLFGIKD